jgi:hypothetical protein
MKQSVVYIGVDIAKAQLDVAWEQQCRRFPNDKERSHRFGGMD